ncbi:hypothetical protein QF015_002171 [Paenarthrobacter sp. TE4293]
MGAVVVRRKVKDPVKDLGMRPEFVAFDPADWDGTSDYQCWVAWDKARTEWAEDHLPDGAEGLPGWDISRFASMPDQPWSEIADQI